VSTGKEHRGHHNTITRKEFLGRCLRCSLGVSLAPTTAMAAAGGLEGEPRRGFVRPWPARHHRLLEKGLVRCELCPHLCLLGPGQRGSCGVRQNRDGRFETLVYGNPCAVHIDPIEKKPLLHFLPGSRSYSVATAGCNLHCKNCQNWEISQRRPEETNNIDLQPEDLVTEAIQSQCRSIAYTYSEPNVFYEYVMDTAVLARERGLKNVLVTAGYINPIPQKELCQVVDAANVDLKGFTEAFYGDVCAGRLKPVLDALILYKQEEVWLEVTNLVLPTLNDDPRQIRKMCLWMRDNLGDEVPLHFSRFAPRYKLRNLPPTPVETLEHARETALEVGLRYVYVGNVPGHRSETTRCPQCGQVLIGRTGYVINELHLNGGCCQFCGQEIPGVWGGV
jgi:pyruvate formate lyase activating enzyme